jgi:hypothetical protein
MTVTLAFRPSHVDQRVRTSIEKVSFCAILNAKGASVDASESGSTEVACAVNRP